MRVSKNMQVITTGIKDRNGNQIPPDSIDWSEYDKNPILQYDRHREGHDGVVVGKVIDRKRVNNGTVDGFIGRLAFMDNFEDADIAFEKYSQGVVQHVSIGGFGFGYEADDGTFVTEKYVPDEVSLVKLPANWQASPIEVSQMSASKKRIVEPNLSTGRVVRYVTMSADTSFLNDKLINSENMVGETIEKPVVASTDTDVPAVVDKPVVASTDTDVPPVVEKPVVASADTDVPAVVEKPVVEKPVVASTDTDVPPVVEKPVVASTDTDVPPVVEKPVVASTEQNMPHGMNWHTPNQKPNQNFNMKTFKELNCDVDFERRMRQLGASIATGASHTDATPENAATLRVLAESMINDPVMRMIASRVSVTNGVTQERSTGYQILGRAVKADAAGAAADATLAVADLGVIKYLSLFYQILLSNDTFRRAIRYVPMTDRTGTIYVESQIDAPTYMGAVSPINVPNYIYQDLPRTIARRVFTFAPITFQHPELAVLAYDKQMWGVSEAMANEINRVSTWWLQVIANTPGISTVNTTGGPDARQRNTATPTPLFPIEAPNSAVDILDMSLPDINSVEAMFLLQNYSLANRNVEMVLPASMYSGLAGDPETRNQLTRELNANLASYINWSATRVTPRNPVARYNTATPGPELDPAMYTDNITNNNGTFTPVTPATTTADHVGAGVAFVANEVLAGMGTVELIVMPDPANYGTTISGWISSGVTVARSGGKGVCLVVPGLA